MDGKSLNITEEKINQLKEILPEAFTENKIDWEKLKAALGDDIEFKNERYVLNWAGKSDAFRALQTPSTDTLVPCKDESVNFDSTGNVFIEGENLEVLKVLQKSYFGKIKMIYIDPPYNTGNDTFIYPDRFSESKEEYLNRIGDKDETGLMTREGLFRKNSKDSGHYHSNWLSMMYPRLFLARNLLRDDGVIFISIDDNEVHNLRLLMNEVFGEENLLAQLVWDLGTGTAAGHFTRAHEYIVVCAKDKNILPNFIYEGKDDSISERAVKKISKGNPASPITFPKGIEFEGEDTTFNNIIGDSEKISILEGKMVFKDGKLFNSVTLEAGWAMRNQILSWLSGEETFDSKGQKVKRFFFDKKGVLQYEKERGFINPQTVLRKIASTRKGTIEIEELFGRKVMDFPKPMQLINTLIGYVTKSRDADIALDFFAGSCTTAHAVLALNKENGGNRKFICVQLPEKCDVDSEAFKAGYKTIAEIGKERIRRVIKKIQEEQEGKLDLDGNGDQDLGFKVFKLKESNFKIWRTNIETEEELIAQMQQHLEPLDEHAKIEDVLYELLIKAGVPLTAKINEQNGYVLVNDNEIALMLERADDKIIKQIIAAKPQKVFTLDRLFKNNDKLKTNTALQMKDAGIEFKVI
ncbi:MAG TPA: site-specific DNA-methyltransferase [Smithella sp.]|jgi:adenine-specific DNA-methyltransferase|nr:site-specific DNA-methyltransferase [Smithella sp.]